MKTSRKVHIGYIDFYGLLIMQAAMQSNASSLPTIYNLHAMLLLVNVMFPSELCR